MEKLYVSVVVPSFNASSYIGELLDGFEAQTYSNWELIIVDDLSTDNTINVIKKYSEYDSRIKLFIRDRGPKGAQTCRNIGIEKSSGTYIILIDADDLVANCFIEQRLKYMISHPEVDYATFRGQSFALDSDGRRIYGRMWGDDPKKDLLSCFLTANYPFGVWNNIYKASVVRSVLFDEKIKVYQDFDFIVNTMVRGYKHAFAENCYTDYYYRQGHSDRITSSFIDAQKYESTKYLFKKIMGALKKTDKYVFYRNSFFQFFLLQYERVLINGSYEQCDDFRQYINNEYGFPKRIKINISWTILKYFVRNKSKKLSAIVFFAIYLLFSPVKLFEWAYNKSKNCK